MTTQPPIPSAPAASPATPSKDPVTSTAPFREWGALLLVVATAVLLFLALINLLVSDTGLGFGIRAGAAFGSFAGLTTLLLPLAGVLLATHLKPVVPKAKVVTLIALIDYAFAVLMGLVCLLASFVQSVSGSAANSFLSLLDGLVWLGLLAFAGFLVLRVYLDAYTAPRPQPAPQGYPGYPGYAGYPGAQGYPPQQQGYPQGYPQQPAGYPAQSYQQSGYPTQAYQAPPAPQPGPAQPSSAPPSGPYPQYSVTPPSSSPPAESGSAAPSYPTSGQPAWSPPSGSPTSAPPNRPSGGPDSPVPTDTGLSGEGNDRTQALPPRHAGGQGGQPGEEPTQRWG